MKNWNVLFVKPRTEKKATEYCALYGIPSYLPLRAKTHVVQRRKVTFMVPVFPGYVFAKFSPEQRLLLLQTNLLVRVLAPLNPPACCATSLWSAGRSRPTPSLSPPSR